MTIAPVTIYFQLKEQSLTITKAEHDLLAAHPDQDAAAAFIRQQYLLRMDAAQSVVEAIKAKAVTHHADCKTVVRYSGEEGSQDITVAEYNMLPHLTTVQATKFIKDQYKLDLYSAKRCADAARAQHKLWNNL
jgi:hypothetical protein